MNPKNKKILLSLTSFFALASMLLSCNEKVSESNPSFITDSNSATDTSDSSNSSGTSDTNVIVPDDLPYSSITLGDVRVQLLSPTLVRVENKGNKGFENRASYIVTNRDEWGKVEYSTTTLENKIVITTDYYQVHIPNNAKAEEVYITSLTGASLWNYNDAGNTDTNVYLPSPSDELKSWYFTDSPRIIPSNYGYSVSTSTDPLQGWDFNNDATDIFVFLPQGDYTQFCTDYIKLTGQTEMTDLQTLGYWDSRWYAYSSETALQQIQDYRDKGYSIDVLVIDTDWRVNASTGYQINETLFPDMAKFLQECEKLGVDVCFNDHPEPVTGGNGLDKEEVAYRNENLTLILSMGLDYWWYDRNWSVSLNSFSPDISVYAFGMYAYNWITTDYLESITDLNAFAERALIMGNVDGCLHGKWNYASDISAHRYSIQWTGDIGSDSTALAQEIYASIFGGAEVGLPYMSSDIGGHTQAVTDSMYSRWIQYGALSTICRVHCTTSAYIGQVGRMPWLFGETAEEVAHTYVDMRYRLLPLFYSLARENYDTGLPIMRRLDIVYPEYVEASRNDQYLLGDYILVAPIAEATINENVPDSYLTHDENGNKVTGLKAEYYNNDNWSGTPVQTKIESNINYDWGTSGPSSVGSDNFSIKWTGNITIGSNDAKLNFFADDSIIVYLDGKEVINGMDVYDTYLKTDALKANSTHTIEVRYAEYGYNAHVYMYYEEIPSAGQSVCNNTRTVFIPEGTWIDVWTGRRYVGPETFTVTHPLETSPIFVREGSLIALAQNMSNTREKDWSEVALDVFPSKNYEASTTLYEDDTNTVAYKDGKYRTTDITMNSEGNSVYVNIAAAQGEFDGKLAFENRKWNVRIHTNPNWGDLTRIKVNGKTVSMNEVSQDKNSEPFAFTGGALDGDIYTFSIEGNVYSSYQIELIYESIEDSLKNENYNKSETPFEMSVEDAGDAVNFTDDLIDWISYGENNTIGYISKNSTSLFSSTSSYDNAWISNEIFFSKNLENGSVITNSRNSQKDFSFEITSTGEESYYVLYLGGNQCTAKVTVRDRAGNVRTEYFGNIDGTFTRRVVIKCPSESEGTLYVTYSMLASETNGTGSPSFVTVIGATASTTLPETVVFEDTGTKATLQKGEISKTGSLSNAGDMFNEETLDWMHFGEEGDIKSVQMINGDIIDTVTFRDGRYFYDYYSSLSYNNGVEIGAHTGTTKGKCTAGDITMKFNIDENVKHIVIYAGVWNATNTVSVYSKNGQQLTDPFVFSAGNSSHCALLVIDVSAIQEDSITVIMRSSNEKNGGNVSLAGIAVTGNYTQGKVTASLDSCETISGSVNLDSEGYTDWVHVGNNDEKANANSITNITTSAQNVYEDFAATLSYTNGVNGSADNLTNGLSFDYAIFNVAVDENTSEIVLYSSIYDATVGISIIDSEGRVILSVEPYEISNVMSSLIIKISLDVTTSENLTIVYYKGGSGTGNAGLAAIAIK